MKKMMLSLCVCIPLFAKSQAITYVDSFSTNYANTYSSSTNYSVSNANGNLRITGNGLSAAYEAFTYSLHSSGVLNNLNITANPKLYVKVKGTNNPTLRIDLQDAAGYNTNLTPIAYSVQSNYTIYTYDFTGKFTDGGYGGSPCMSGMQCPVNSSGIKKLLMFINPVNGGYNGVVDIDWISFGAPLEVPTDYKIMYNQVSYLKGKTKIINFVSRNPVTPKSYKIFDSNNQQVLSGITGATSFWTDGGLNVAKVDITSIDVVGAYRLETPEYKINFKISIDGYEPIADAAVKYFYFNRASSPVTSALGGVYVRNAGHPDNVVQVHSSAASPGRPAGFVLFAPKGWYDAGDYNKYVVNSGISTYTLLAAFNNYKEFYKTKNYEIPERGGSMPDLLDEIIWNLDWMLAMQDPNDGGVYHKLTEANFSGIAMPENVKSTRYVTKKSTAAALNFAAVMAVASRIFESYQSVKPNYSTTLLEAAKKAYTWAKNNPTQYFSNPSDINTGVYGDGNVTDEFRWAATELYITTNTASYKTDINLPAISAAIPYWGGVDALALYSMSKNQSRFTPAEISTVTTKLTAVADDLKNKVNTSVMNISMSGNGDYTWGSNSGAANQILALLYAYELSNDVSYLNAAYTAMDYLLGRNATGYCYVTGYGSTSPVAPHHRISAADEVTAPVPGMLVGGPNLERPGGECPGYPANENASSYLDDWCSYSTNEVTINWNAPLAYALNALQYYETKNFVTTSINPIALSISKQMVSFPNPVRNRLSVKVIDKLIGGNISIYTIGGKLAKTMKINQRLESIDLSGFNNGIYVLKAEKGNISVVSKVIKN